MHHNGRFLTLFEANIAYVITCFLIRKYPELVFKQTQKYGYIESIYLYLPNYYTSADVAYASEISLPLPNNVEHKTAPAFAMIGLDV